MKEYYDRRAPEYDDWWLGTGAAVWRQRPGWEEDLAELIATLEALPRARTLDVACGTGFLTRHLRGEVVGLDWSERMLDIARSRVPHATFVQGDALVLPFADHSFERVFASYFYCHLEEAERRAFLREARRVAPSLVVVASVRRDQDPARFEERILGDGTRWQVYKRYFEPEELAAELGGTVVFSNRRFVVATA